MAQGDPRKWHMPGWRIEQKYSPGVLIGNWDEDRYTVRILNMLNFAVSYCTKSFLDNRPQSVDTSPGAIQAPSGVTQCSVLGHL